MILRVSSMMVVNEGPERFCRGHWLARFGRFGKGG